VRRFQWGYIAGLWPIGRRPVFHGAVGFIQFRRHWYFRVIIGSRDISDGITRCKR
jgi:hypothetical protein